MKSYIFKATTIVIIVALLLPSFVFMVNASESSKLTNIEDFVNDAFIRYIKIQMGSFLINEGPLPNGMNVDDTRKTFLSSSSGETYDTPRDYWFFNNELNFNTLKQWVDYMEEYYTPEATQRLMLSWGRQGKELSGIELIRWDKEYNVLRYYPGAQILSSEELGVKQFESFSNNIANFVVLVRSEYYRMTITIENTEKGLRISGGTLFDYLQDNIISSERIEYYVPPHTGDTSSYTVPALTVAAIISVALPVTLLRKRRRVV
ncbi:MAG: LPXTG cell wall anchor domain-containing protein [Clostridia bacterium]|nr:LPXTG cell wall anchor domain-containing protein [Clostridia bacterium]